ncbi:MAG: hypothetical protein IT186_03855 [Acidobacteria bacterium]|nr:hypothetical protein [Acidobacteriota bacterium]
MLETEWNEEQKFPPSGSTPGYFPAGRWVGWTLKLSKRAYATAEKPQMAISVKKDSVKAGGNFYLSESMKLGIAGKVEKLTVADFCEAIRTRNLGGLCRKCLGLEAVLGATITQNFSIGGGAEISWQPFIVKMEIKGGLKQFRVNPGAKLVAQLNIGPSTEGWAQIFRRTGEAVGKASLQAARLGPLAGQLAAAGVVTMAGIAAATLTASFGVLAGTATYAGYVSRRGEDKGHATFYGSAYAAVVAGRNTPDNWHWSPEGRKRQQELVNQARSDARQDAMRHVANFGIELSNQGDWDEALSAWRGALSDKFGVITEEAGYRALKDYVTDRAFEKIRAGEL